VDKEEKSEESTDKTADNSPLQENQEIQDDEEKTSVIKKWFSKKDDTPNQDNPNKG